jgi:cbb3-type cytochrome oxidase subunit 3
MNMRHAITAAILLAFSLASVAVLASLLQQLATRH